MRLMGGCRSIGTGGEKQEKQHFLQIYKYSSQGERGRGGTTMNSHKPYPSQKVAVGEVRKIIEETRNRKSQITCLEVNNIRIQKLGPELKQTFEELYNLQILCLVDCWLTSLGNLPSLKKLEHLDLTGNRISDDEIPLLSKYPGLKILRLGYNTLSRMDTLQLLRFAALEQLQLYENPLSAEANYRELTFQRIPTLRILDGQDKYGQIIEDYADYEEDIISVASDHDSDDMEDWNRKIEEAHQNLAQELGQEGLGFDDEEEEEQQEQLKKTSKKEAKKGAKKGGKKGAKHDLDDE